jgi:hypothetical protein
MAATPLSLVNPYLSQSRILRRELPPFSSVSEAYGAGCRIVYLLRKSAAYFLFKHPAPPNREGQDNHMSKDSHYISFILIRIAHPDSRFLLLINHA